VILQVLPLSLVGQVRNKQSAPFLRVIVYLTLVSASSIVDVSATSPLEKRRSSSTTALLELFSLRRGTFAARLTEVTAALFLLGIGITGLVRMSRASSLHRVVLVDKLVQRLIKIVSQSSGTFSCCCRFNHFVS